MEMWTVFMIARFGLDVKRFRACFHKLIGGCSRWAW